MVSKVSNDNYSLIPKVCDELSNKKVEEATKVLYKMAVDTSLVERLVELGNVNAIVIKARLNEIANQSIDASDPYRITKIFIQKIIQQGLVFLRLSENIQGRQKDGVVYFKSNEMNHKPFFDALHSLFYKHFYLKTIEVASAAKETSFASALGQTLIKKLKYISDIEIQLFNILENANKLHDESLYMLVKKLPESESVEKLVKTLAHFKKITDIPGSCWGSEIQESIVQIIKNCSADLFLKVGNKLLGHFGKQAQAFIIFTFNLPDCSPRFRNLLLIELFANNSGLIANLLEKDLPFEVGEGEIHPLFLAVGCRDAAMVELFCKRFNPNVKDSQGKTPLHLATSLGFGDVTRALIASKADVNAADNEEDTPLVQALNELKLIELLVGAKADINVVNSNGMTPFLTAVSKRMTAVVGYFFAMKLHVEELSTAVRIAVRNFDGIMVNLLLSNSPNPSEILNQSHNLFRIQYRDSNSEFAKEAEFILYLFLKHGMDPNLKKHKGTAVLAYTINTQKTALLEPMLKSGKFDINLPAEGGKTPLHFTLEHCQKPKKREAYTKIAVRLLQEKPEVDAQTDKGVTPLMMAASAGIPSLVELLLASGASLDKYDENGRSAFYYSSNSEVAQLLSKSFSKDPVENKQ